MGIIRLSECRRITYTVITGATLGGRLIKDIASKIDNVARTVIGGLPQKIS